MIALLLLGLAQDPEPFARARAGAWASGGFEFETLVATGKREIDGAVLWSLGADVGVAFDDRWLVFGGGDWSFANDVEVRAVHLSGGYRMQVERWGAMPPFRLDFSAGALWGTFEVDKTGFGDFDSGLGARAGATALFELGATFSVGAYVEVRVIRFYYEEDVLDGDRYAAGGGVAAGLIVEARW